MAEEKGLSDRERQILRLVATGASNKEIARQLVISTNTVKVHLRNIFAKIGVVSRTEATLYAIREGLVQVGEARPAEAPMSGERAVLEVGDAAPSPQQAVAEAMPTDPPGASEQAKRRRLIISALVAAVAVVMLLLGIWAGAVIGSQGGPTPTVEAGFSTPAAVAGPSRWRLRAPMLTARAGLGAAVYDSRIYAIAGDASDGPTGANERYDPTDDKWTALAAKPVPVADVSAAVVGGRVYVPGGRVAGGAVTSTVEVYDPAHDTWERRAPLPVAVSAYAMVAFEGRLYVFGGWDGTAYRADTYEYDPGRDAWAARTPMPTARGFAGAAVAGGRVYVAGGTNDGKTGLTVNEAYAPSREEATPWASRAPLPSGQVRVAAASIADLIHLVIAAGVRGGSALRYSVGEDSWQTFEGTPSESGAGLSLVALQSSIHILGGVLGGDVLSEHQSYQAIFEVNVPVLR